jgi:hypothetical protein
MGDSLGMVVLSEDRSVTMEMLRHAGRLARARQLSA